MVAEAVGCALLSRTSGFYISILPSAYIRHSRLAVFATISVFFSPSLLAATPAQSTLLSLCSPRRRPNHPRVSLQRPAPLGLPSSSLFHTHRYSHPFAYTSVGPNSPTTAPKPQTPNPLSRIARAHIIYAAQSVLATIPAKRACSWPQRRVMEDR